MVDESTLSGIAVVIGAGTMGGGIAADLANAGWRVHLLDITNDAAVAGRERVKSARPPLLFVPETADRIHVGNMTDDLGVIAHAHWIVEAVAERMDVKQTVLALVEHHLGPEAVISSNTSGLSLTEMVKDRSETFKARFFGSHFLNPPRYLKLLEVIPTQFTDASIMQAFGRFAEQVLGHRIVVARDTPGFISTRIGIWHLLDSIRLAVEMGLDITTADYLSGALIGRPKTGIFRLADIVGLDVISAIARDQYSRLADDPYRDRYVLPAVMQSMIDRGRLGDKAGGGFYRREGAAVLALDLRTGHYELKAASKPLEPTTADLMRLPLADRLKRLSASADKPLDFVNAILDSLDKYVRYVAPLIAPDELSVDHVMQWGFGWEIGPFEIAQSRQTILRSGSRRASEPPSDTTNVTHARSEPFPWLRVEPDESEYISLARLKADGATVLDSAEGSLIDLGDGIVCLEYHTKMNTFGPGLTSFVNAALARAQSGFVGLVIGNQAAHFSAGYNLNLFLDAAADADWARIDRELSEVQNAFMGLKYATIPVVAAPHGYTLGAGCEGCLHCAAVQASAELYMGLPEASIGVVPAGGGTKEMLARAMSVWNGIGDPFPLVSRLFSYIAFPRQSTSAADAQKLGLLRPSDSISRNADRKLYDAKQRALSMARAGYSPPAAASIHVMGEDALARLRMTVHSRRRAGQISDHDRLMCDRIAYLVSGGCAPHARIVTEDYMLKLEREVFLEVVREPKSIERLKHVLATGKPLKN